MSKVTRVTYNTVKIIFSQTYHKIEIHLKYFRALSYYINNAYFRKIIFIFLTLIEFYIREKLIVSNASFSHKYYLVQY